MIRTLEEAMEEIRTDRGSNDGGHTFKRHLDRYGPAAYFYELAGILGRLEALLADRGNIAWQEDFEWDRCFDLLIDLGNYDKFLFEWLQWFRDQMEKEAVRNPPVHIPLGERISEGHP